MTKVTAWWSAGVVAALHSVRMDILCGGGGGGGGDVAVLQPDMQGKISAAAHSQHHKKLLLLRSSAKLKLIAASPSIWEFHPVFCPLSYNSTILYKNLPQNETY